MIGGWRFVVPPPPPRMVWYHDHWGVRGGGTMANLRVPGRRGEILSFSIKILSISIEILSISIEILSISIKLLSISIKILNFSVETLWSSIEILSFSIKILSFPLPPNNTTGGAGGILKSLHFQLSSFSFQLPPNHSTGGRREGAKLGGWRLEVPWSPFHPKWYGTSTMGRGGAFEPPIIYKAEAAAEAAAWRPR